MSPASIPNDFRLPHAYNSRPGRLVGDVVGLAVVGFGVVGESIGELVGGNVGEAVTGFEVGCYQLERK